MPPEGWRPFFAIDLNDEANTFETRLQRIHQLQVQQVAGLLALSCRSGSLTQPAHHVDGNSCYCCCVACSKDWRMAMAACIILDPIVPMRMRFCSNGRVVEK